jgi:hypothetical protein
MPIRKSRLLHELRKRFASPAHVLRRLGLDESLLQVEHEHDDLGKRVRARFPAAHKFMSALARSGLTPQAAMRRLGMDAALLDDHEPGLREAVDALMREHFPDATDDNPFFKGMHELVDEHERRSDPRGKGGGGGSIVGSGHEGEDDTGEEIVQRFGSFDRRRPRGRDIEPLHGSENLPPKTESMPPQRLSNDRDDSQYEDFKDHLRKNSEMRRRESGFSMTKKSA